MQIKKRKEKSPTAVRQVKKQSEQKTDINVVALHQKLYKKKK